MLRVDDLEVAYGAAVALQDCSMEVPERGCVAVLGANGAGKSTLLRTVARAIRQRHGEVHWNGACIDRWSADRAARAGIALVPEGRRLFPAMTVRENVEVGAARRPAREVRDAVDHAVERFPELRARLDVAAGRLSGGEQQMVALARALAGAPRLLLIDELSLGLAPAVTDRIYAHLRDILAEGVSVVVVEQYADLAVEVAGRVVVLEKGRVAFSGSPAELRARPDVLETAYLGRQLLEAQA